MLDPYYQQDGVTIYHADCRDVLDEWEGLRTHSFDLLLTDPPYGIGASSPKRGGRQDGASLAPSRDWGMDDWDNEPVDAETLIRCRNLARYQIIFGGNYFHLPPARCWLVWDKNNGTNAYADCELAWTNLDKAVRKLTYRWMGLFTEATGPKEPRVHPTQKPEPVMRWALSQAPSDVVSVLDPFMGSGTTLVAAKRFGKRATGIEREERYCEIAAERVRQGVLTDMFHADSSARLPV